MWFCVALLEFAEGHCFGFCIVRCRIVLYLVDSVEHSDHRLGKGGAGCFAYL